MQNISTHESKIFLDLVSIIIPCYNAFAYIEDTLQSVINQSYKNIEIVIIDDHSNDGSYQLIKGYECEKIRIFKNHKKGACSARNMGFVLSKGDYIQFLDADDILSPNKIESQVSILKSNYGKLAACNTKIFWTTLQDATVINEKSIYSTDDNVEFLLNLYGSRNKPNMITCSAWLTPRNLIKLAGPWDETLIKDQDGEFFCRVVLKSKGICYTPHVYDYYRKHLNATNIAAQRSKEAIFSQLKALKSKDRELSKHTNSQDYHKVMALQYKILAIDSWPKFHDLYNKAMKLSKSHGGSDYLPVLGGNIIEFLKNTMGWKFSKFFSYYLHKFF